MKAAVYDRNGPPDVFRYEEVPDPPVHARGVVVEVAAVSIEGATTSSIALAAVDGNPQIGGYQCAGYVREVGAEVKSLLEGDAVVCVMGNGSHAELVSVPEQACWRVPAELSIEEAACVPRSVRYRQRLPLRTAAARRRVGARAGGERAASRLPQCNSRSAPVRRCSLRRRGKTSCSG